MPTFDPTEVEFDPQDYDHDLFAPDGDPWCKFERGSFDCVNGERCQNPNHGRRRRLLNGGGSS